MTKNERRRKRALDVDESMAFKRSKEDTNPHVTSDRPPQFQCFHLLLLQSLYDTDSNNAPVDKKDDDDSLGSVTNDDLSEIMDDTVDDKLWSKARKFVKERDHLLKLKKEASRLDNITKEAIAYMGEQASELTAPSTPPGKQTLPSWQQCWTDVDDGPSSAGRRHRSVASPSSLSFFSPERASSPLQLPGLACGVQSPEKCFGLVTTILQKTSQSFNSNVKRESNPHGPVLEEIIEKIDALEGKLRRLQENTLSKQKQKVEDLLSRALLSSSYDNFNSMDLSGASEPEDLAGDQFDMKSFISKLETRLHLWNMLAADLKLVCG